MFPFIHHLLVSPCTTHYVAEDSSLLESYSVSTDSYRCFGAAYCFYLQGRVHKDSALPGLGWTAWPWRWTTLLWNGVNCLPVNMGSPKRRHGSTLRKTESSSTLLWERQILKRCNYFLQCITVNCVICEGRCGGGGANCHIHSCTAHRKLII